MLLSYCAGKCAAFRCSSYNFFERASRVRKCLGLFYESNMLFSEFHEKMLNQTGLIEKLNRQISTIWLGMIFANAKCSIFK